MKQDDSSQIAFISGMFFAFLLSVVIAIVVFINTPINSYELKVREVIAECQKSLPRDQFCKAIIKAEVVPVENK